MIAWANVINLNNVNYSDLLEQDEEGAHRRLVEGMKIMEAFITAKSGRIVHTAGGAILAEFREVDVALQCAVRIQLAVRELNARLRVSQWLQFRIGVEFLDVTADNDDIYSNAINLAAWPEKLTHSGGIYVPESVRLELEITLHSILSH